jgi:hypothetical protein
VYTCVQTGPSTFFFKRVSMFSTNYKVLQNDENGKLWLFLKKNGGWFSDNAYFILENFVSTWEAISLHLSCPVFCSETRKI